MRLSKEMIDIIKLVIQENYDNNTRVYLFGSRTDDNKKGGDIDLYVETNLPDSTFERRLRVLARLNSLLGEQKIDLLVNCDGKEKYIYKIAKNEGILL